MTSLLQPLDRMINNPFKKYLKIIYCFNFSPSALIDKRHVIWAFSLPVVFIVTVFYPILANEYDREESNVIAVSSQLIIPDKSYSLIFIYFILCLKK